MLVPLRACSAQGTQTLEMFRCLVIETTRCQRAWRNHPSYTSQHRRAPLWVHRMIAAARWCTDERSRSRNRSAPKPAIVIFCRHALGLPHVYFGIATYRLPGQLKHSCLSVSQAHCVGAANIRSPALLPYQCQSDAISRLGDLHEQYPSALRHCRNSRADFKRFVFKQVWN